MILKDAKQLIIDNVDMKCAVLNGVVVWEKKIIPTDPPSTILIDAKFDTIYNLSRSVSESNPGYLLLTEIITSNQSKNFPFFSQTDCFYDDRTVTLDGVLYYVYETRLQEFQGTKTEGEILNWGTVIPTGTKFLGTNSNTIKIYDTI